MRWWCTPFFRLIVAGRTFFFGSRFGIRDGSWGRDDCADEDENPGLSQPRRSEGSFFQDFFSVTVPRTRLLSSLRAKMSLTRGPSGPRRRACASLLVVCCWTARRLGVVGTFWTTLWWRWAPVPLRPLGPDWSPGIY